MKDIKNNIEVLLNNSMTETSKDVIKKITEEVKKRLETIIKSNKDMSEGDIMLLNNVIVRGLEDTKYTSEIKINDLTFKDIEDSITKEVNKNKLEAIPESLKLFINEDGTVNDDKLKEIKNAITSTAAQKELIKFKELKLVKELEGEVIDLTEDVVKNIKDLMNPEKFDLLMNGKLSPDDLVFKLITPYLKKEEVKKEEEVEEIVDDQIKGFHSIAFENEEKKKSVIKEIDDSLAVIVEDKKNYLKNNHKKLEDSFTHENEEITINEYEKKMREKLEDNFYKKQV